jgi:hypothetical protein
MPTEQKPILTDLVRNNPKTPEGKYLVKRRDGTVVEWPSWVLGARDPAAPVALRSYADCGERLGWHPGMVAAIRNLADEFEQYRSNHGTGDPDRGIHRKDDPDTVREMKLGRSS